jgi:signal transduction histidine kinase
MNNQRSPLQKEPTLPVPGATERSSTQGTILIVDDALPNLRLLSLMLTERGYKVRAVRNGARALEAVQANPPDLILLDIMMPGMNGYEVCERLKADEQTSDIPIVFLSALGAAEDKVKAFTVGGVDYITKPFRVEEVLARVETHMALRNLQRSLQQKVAELDAFAHTIAHDLKNTLNNIWWPAEILGEFAVEGDAGSDVIIPKAELQWAIQQIRRSTQKMNSVIESLLLLARARKQDVEIVPLDMAAIMHDVQHRLAGVIQEYQAEITWPENWIAAKGYDPWVEQVWTNYISNAIKYGGRPPRVEVGITDQGDGTVRFWVRDNGPGLSLEEQTRLFTPFERLHQDRAEGHGLGLSIVQHIVEKLGGQVGVESQKGQGSVFWFTLLGGKAIPRK